jgi:hypothetical protein
MKKRKVEYRKGAFVDFSGRTREYIVAAVSELLPNAAAVTGPGKKYDTPVQYRVTELCGDGHVDIGDQVIKRVSLGFAVCSPDDTFNEELGKEIALGKALKRPSGVLYASKAGMINTDLVDALISQEMLYFENNPGAVLAGYDKAKETFLAQTHEAL